MAKKSNSLKPTGSDKAFDHTTVPFSDAIELANFMHNEKTNLTLEGKFIANAYIVSFLPQSYVGGGEINYDEYSIDKAKIRMKIMTASGDLVETIKYKAVKARDITGPFHRLFIYNKSPREVQLSEGDYNLEWSFSDGTIFYNFPFSVFSKGSDDPYAGDNSKFHFMTSDTWENLICYKYNVANNMELTFYYQNSSIEVKQRKEEARPIKHYVELYKNGKIFAQQDNLHYASSGQKVDYQQTNFTRGEWAVKTTARFKEVVSERDKQGLSSGKNNLKESDMTDGKYKFKVYVDNKEFSYSFEIKNNKFVYLPEQNRKTMKDQTRIIEGANSVFWIRKNK